MKSTNRLAMELRISANEIRMSVAERWPKTNEHSFPELKIQGTAKVQPIKTAKANKPARTPPPKGQRAFLPFINSGHSVHWRTICPPGIPHLEP
jgi:hypothetical protein